MRKNLKLFLHTMVVVCTLHTIPSAYAQFIPTGDILNRITQVQTLAESVTANYNLVQSKLAIIDGTDKNLMKQDEVADKINTKQQEQIAQTKAIIQENKVTEIKLKSLNLAYKDKDKKPQEELEKIANEMGAKLYRDGAAGGVSACSNGKRMAGVPQAGNEMKRQCEAAQNWRAAKQKVTEDYWAKMKIVQEDLETIATASQKSYGEVVSKQLALDAVRTTTAVINDQYKSYFDYVDSKIAVASDIQEKASNQVTGGKPAGSPLTAIVGGIGGIATGSVAMRSGW